MTRSKPSRHSAGAPGAKLLITTTAFAATLGGWAALARQQPEPIAEPLAQAEPATAVVSAPPVQFAPIPTIVPLAQPREVAVARPPSINVPTQPAANPQTVPAVPVQAAQPVAASQPLRSVNVPAAPAQQPVARTRSSR